MPPRPPNRFDSALAVFMTCLVGFVTLYLATNIASGTEQASFTRYDRPDTDTIRLETHNILTDSRFAPRKSFWQAFLQWLGDKLSNWKVPKLPRGLAWLLMVVLLTWSVLTLVAILVHLGWTVYVLWRGRASGPAPDAQGNGFGARACESYEDLIARMRELAGKGAFYDAIAVMMIALLRWLDRASVLRFHQSKTNGDYVHEYPADSPTRDQFGHFVLTFDETIYGGGACGRQVYQQIHSMFEQICDRVQKEQ